MGIFKRLFGKFRKQKIRLLVLGLDNSGKTTILNFMKPKKAVIETVPTVGYAVEEFTKNNIQFSAFDMSGQGKYRDLWNSYYNEAQGVIFVIDATDEIRFAVAKEELRIVLESQELKQRRVPILFFANKMDIHTAASPVICMTRLGLEEITEIPWHIQSCSAVTGLGVEDGFKWLLDTVQMNEHTTSIPSK